MPSPFCLVCESGYPQCITRGRYAGERQILWFRCLAVVLLSVHAVFSVINESMDKPLKLLFQLTRYQQLFFVLYFASVIALHRKYGFNLSPSVKPGLIERINGFFLVMSCALGPVVTLMYWILIHEGFTGWLMGVDVVGSHSAGYLLFLLDCVLGTQQIPRHGFIVPVVFTVYWTLMSLIYRVSISQPLYTALDPLLLLTWGLYVACGVIASGFVVLHYYLHKPRQ